MFTELAKSPNAETQEEANNALMNAVGGVLMNCEPGWTGSTCENRSVHTTLRIMNAYTRTIFSDMLAAKFRDSALESGDLWSTSGYGFFAELRRSSIIPVRLA